MDINYDAVRYGRDWRYGTLQAPYEEVGSLERVYWLAFPHLKRQGKIRGRPQVPRRPHGLLVGTGDSTRHWG